MPCSPLCWEGEGRGCLFPSLPLLDASTAFASSILLLFSLFLSLLTAMEVLGERDNQSRAIGPAMSISPPPSDEANSGGTGLQAQHLRSAPLTFYFLIRCPRHFLIFFCPSSAPFHSTALAHTPLLFIYSTRFDSDCCYLFMCLEKDIDACSAKAK